MKIKLFLILILITVFAGCNREKEPKTIRPKGDFNVHEPDQSDRQPNGGKLRFTLDRKQMHDDFFVAQFTPKGDMFEYDNLQLYNYNLGSDKYPQFIVSIDFSESNLKAWEGKTFPLDFLAFTASENTLPFNSRGEIRITKVTDQFVEGTFDGELVHPETKKAFPIKGEFRAMIKVNV